MAVCGRCLLCGYKFNGQLADGTEPDMGVRWECESTRDYCVGREPHEHKICNTCITALLDGTLEGAVADIVALLTRRSEH